MNGYTLLEEGDEPEPITYQPKMNMQRFQQFLAAEEKNNTLSTISGQAHLSHLDQGPVQSTRIQETQSLQTTRGETNVNHKNNTLSTISGQGETNVNHKNNTLSTIKFTAFYFGDSF